MDRPRLSVVVHLLAPDKGGRVTAPFTDGRYRPHLRVGTSGSTLVLRSSVVLNYRWVLNAPQQLSSCTREWTTQLFAQGWSSVSSKAVASWVMALCVASVHATFGLTLRCTRSATAGFAICRTRVSSNVRRMGIRLFILGVTLLPLLLMLAGGGLSEVLSCTAGAQSVHSCRHLPWLASVLTFLTIYCGWGMVFTIPVGGLILLLMGAPPTTERSHSMHTPNPSLHPKCYGGLRPLAHSGELKR
jgi:hypothetical protein